MVLALVGDSTITSALPLPAAWARGRAALAAPFPARPPAAGLGPAAATLGRAAAALAPLAGLAAGLALAGDFADRLGLVTMNSVCLLGSSSGQPSVAARNPRRGGGARRPPLSLCG